LRIEIVEVYSKSVLNQLIFGVGCFRTVLGLNHPTLIKNGDLPIVIGLPWEFIAEPMRLVHFLKARHKLQIIRLLNITIHLISVVAVCPDLSIFFVLDITWL
jgi:hypothetical protein